MGRRWSNRVPVGSASRWFAPAMLLVLAAPPGALAIVNGAAVGDERYAAEFPWAVALEYPPATGVCTAQLVSPTWVLTAAHCTSVEARVLTGDPSRSRARAQPVVAAIRHPRYDEKTGHYDIGLLQLGQPLGIRPVPLITRREADELLVPGARAIIAGWGKRSSSSGFAERLVVSDVELRGLDRSNGRFAYEDAASGPCGGDSGGPLLVVRRDGTAVLAGVASRIVGDVCAQWGGIGIYADVAASRDFIEQHVKNLWKRRKPR